MNEETRQMLTEFTSQLANIGEAGWEAMIRQAYIMGTFGLIAHVFSIVILMLLWAGVKLMKDKTDQQDCALFLSFATILYIVGLVVSAPAIITALLNPEYWALRKILLHC